MSDGAIISTYGLSCSHCNARLRFEYECTKYVVCTDCSHLVSRDGKKEFPVDTPEEDRCRIRTGSRGKWKEQSFVVTGRIRMLYTNDTYVNLWHIVHKGNCNSWIAEAYHSYAILELSAVKINLKNLLALKPGPGLTMEGEEYFLASSETLKSIECEGELPALPEKEKLMYVTITSSKRSTIHFRIKSKTEYQMYTGRNTEPAQLELTNLRF